MCVCSSSCNIRDKSARIYKRMGPDANLFFKVASSCRADAYALFDGTNGRGDVYLKVAIEKSSRILRSSHIRIYKDTCEEFAARR